MTYIILDIETNGIGSFRPPSQRPVQVSWITHNNGNVVEASHFVKGTGPISTSSTYPCTHITDELLEKDGIPFLDVWERLKEGLSGVTTIVSHNCDFDVGCLIRELERNGVGEEVELLITKKMVCTMKESTDFCAIPKTGNGARFGGYKWPKLSELYRKLFGQETTAALHDSLEDCRVLHACYTRGRELNVFE